MSFLDKLLLASGAKLTPNAVTRTLAGGSALSGQGAVVSGPGGPASVATSGPLSSVLIPYGVFLSPATSGAQATITTQGVIDPSIKSLGNGPICAVGLDVAGNLVRVTDAACVSGLKQLGVCDGSGTIYVSPIRKPHFIPSDFGAVGDGVTDDTAALNACIKAAGATLGLDDEQPAGIIHLEPSQKYYCASQLIVNDLANIVFRGPGQIVCGIAAAATDFFLLKSCARITFEDVIITYSSSTFTGNLFKVSNTGTLANDASSIVWLRCDMYGSDLATGHHQANAGIALSGCEDIDIIACDFNGMKQAIDSDYSSFANRVTIVGCNFFGLTNGGIHNPGQAWSIIGCTFEPLEVTFYSQNAIFMDPTGLAYALSIKGCWFGDGHPDPGGGSNWVHVTANGLDISGNLFATEVPGYNIQCDSCQGVSIVGNYFNGDSIRFELQSGGPINSGVFIVGNTIAGATNPIDFTHVSTFTSLASQDTGHMPNVLSIPIRFGSNDAASILSGFFQKTFSWTPGTIAAGAFATTTVAVTEAQAGDVVAIGCNVDLGAGVILAGNMYTNGSCRVTLFNATGSPVTIGALTLRVVTMN